MPRDATDCLVNQLACASGFAHLPSHTRHPTDAVVAIPAPTIATGARHNGYAPAFWSASQQTDDGVIDGLKRSV
jgi:hypothetical protein